MIKRYKSMIIIALIMSALVNIVAWGEEGLSNNGNNPTVDPSISDDIGVSVGDVIPLQPLTPEEGNNEPEEDKSSDNEQPGIIRDFQSPDDSSGGVGTPDNDSYSDWLLYSLSVDSLTFGYLENISQNIISLNEVLISNAKSQKSIEKQLSGISSRDADYQARMLYYMARLSKLVSGNGAELLGVSSSSLEEIKVALSLNDLYEVSEDLIEYEEESVSENLSEKPETVSGEVLEGVSPDKVSDNSVSKADIEALKEQNEQLHDDLKGIFIVNIFAVLFLALMTAGQLEQIIFKRIRG